MRRAPFRSPFAAPSLDVSPRAMEDLATMRRRFLETGHIDPRVRPVVRSAWQRCMNYGVSPDRLPPQRRDPQRLEQRRQANRALLDCVNPFIEQVRHSLTGEKHLISVADADGVVLHMSGDADVVQSLEYSDTLFTGASWAEKDVGCNGIGTALAEGEAVLLLGPEHYLEAYAPWTCIGIPLRRADGSTAGAMDFAVPNEQVNIHTWGWVLSIGQAIEAQLAGADRDTEALAALRNLDNPFNAVRGVLDLLTRQLGVSPTHAGFMDEAVAALDVSAERFRAIFEQVIQSQKRLREMDARKDRFLAMLSHELRNPLHLAALTLDAVRENDDAPSQDPESFQILSQQIILLTRLCDDLLDHTRITQGRLSLQLERIDLVSVVAESLEASRGLLTERRHNVRTALAPEPLPIRGDAHRLRQVVNNLLRNAAKYTEPGGRIEVTLEREDESAVLRIQDSGIGIAADALPHVFDMFVQGSNASSHAQGGLGIGLSLVRRLVEMHDGSVSAHSDGPGQGSRFTVHLPLTG